MKIEKILFALLMTAAILVSCNGEEDLFLNPETGTVSDCQGNVYATVKIGNQWWMAENLRCTQYDTDSERQPSPIEIPVSTRPAGVNYGPFYVDVRDSITSYSGNLTLEQRSKLGLLYTWAAAVGLSSANNATNPPASYTDQRQGICPNGWRIPTDDEWTVLIDYLGGHEKAGKKMRTSTGWYKGEDYVAGDNNSGFSILPAGYDLGTSIGTDRTPATYGIGFDANFWSANANAWYRGFTCNSAEVKRWPYAKFTYLSVRCIKNTEE